MVPVEGPLATLPYVRFFTQLSSDLSCVFRATYCEVTVTGSDASAVAVAVILMFPGIAVELTMDRALPLNALRPVPFEMTGRWGVPIPSSWNYAAACGQDVGGDKSWGRSVLSRRECDLGRGTRRLYGVGSNDPVSFRAVDTLGARSPRYAPVRIHRSQGNVLRAQRDAIEIVPICRATRGSNSLFGSVTQEACC